jgi:TolB-like protein
MRNKIKTYILIILLIPAVLLCQQNNSNSKITLAVLDFKAVNGIDQSEAILLTNKFRSDLLNYSNYIILAREEMEAVLKEQGFSISGLCSSEECAVEIGQILAASKIVVGEIGKIGATFTITVKLINVSTSEIERMIVKKYVGRRDDLLNVFDEIARELAGKKSSHLFKYLSIPIIGGAITYFIIKPKFLDKDKNYLPEPPKP